MKRILIIIFSIISFYACSDKEQKVLLILENGSGLSEKTDVTFKGKKIGSLKKINIIDKNLIAEVSIFNDFPIYNESEFYIVSTDLLGGRAIEVENPLSGKLYDKNAKDTFQCKIKPSSIEVMIKEIFNAAETLIDTLRK